MDPNVTLAVIRDLVAVSRDRALSIRETNELSEACDSMDAWLSKGGFWPDGWNRNGGATCGRCSDAKDKHLKSTGW